MARLSANEQQDVRRTLQFLKRRFGYWARIAAILEVKADALVSVMRGRPVTPQLANRVAKLVDGPIDQGCLIATWITETDLESEFESRAPTSALQEAA